MPRPQKTRTVRHDPHVVYFKPAGVPMRVLKEVSLGIDELEALRLADLENLSHEEVGNMMGVSRATAGRILGEARRKTAAALVHGWAIQVEGGEIERAEDEGACENPAAGSDDDSCDGAGPRDGSGRGQGRGPGRGSGRGSGRGRHRS